MGDQICVIMFKEMGLFCIKKVMNKVTISVEHKIATNNKSEEVKKNEMAVLNRFEVHR